MPSTNSFLTDRGIATLVDGELMFEESWTGYVRALYDRYWRDGRGTQKAMIIGYALASLSALVFLASVVLRQEVFLIATVVGAVALTWSLDRARGFRSADRISLSAISDISVASGIQGLTKPRLVIRYTDDGHCRKRRVTLPSKYATNGHTAYTRARSMFNQHGFELS